MSSDESVTVLIAPKRPKSPQYASKPPEPSSAALAKLGLSPKKRASPNTLWSDPSNLPPRPSPSLPSSGGFHTSSPDSHVHPLALNYGVGSAAGLSPFQVGTGLPLGLAPSAPHLATTRSYGVGGNPAGLIFPAQLNSGLTQPSYYVPPKPVLNPAATPVSLGVFNTPFPPSG